MTNKKAQKIIDMYEHHKYECFVCPKTAKQRAHIIGDTKANRKIFNTKIIDHVLNWLPACGLHHNSLIDISNNQSSREAIAILIETCTDENFNETRALIEDEVKENIRRKINKNEK